MLVERGADRVVGADEQQRIAVRRRIDRRGGGDIAAGAGAVLHHELLAEMLRQPLAHDARHDVDRAAGGKADQPAHRPVRIVGGGCRRDAAARLERQTIPTDAVRKIRIITAPCMLLLARRFRIAHAFTQIGTCLHCLLADVLASVRGIAAAAGVGGRPMNIAHVVCAGVLLLAGSAAAQEGGTRPFKRPRSVSGRRRRAAAFRFTATPLPKS